MVLGGVSWPSLPTFFPSCLRPAAYSANCDFFRGPRIETCVVFERWPAIWARHDCAPPIWRGDGFLEPVVFRDVKSVSCFYPFCDRRYRILRINPFLRNIIYRVFGGATSTDTRSMGPWAVGQTTDAFPGKLSPETLPHKVSAQYKG